MFTLPLAVSLMLLGSAPGHDAAHGAKHGGHGQHQRHGNPADLEGYVKHLESPDRNAWQKPDEVVKALAPKPGQTVCDIGAGPGYFALRLARAVGEKGTVYAVDVEPQLLAALHRRIAATGARNVTPVFAVPDDPLLPPASCDLVLIVNTFHHFPDGVAYLERLKRALKPGGRIANIDYHKRELPLGPPPDHKISREEFLASAAAAGLALDSEKKFLPYQYFVILRPG